MSDVFDERMPVFLRQRLESSFSGEDRQRIAAGYAARRGSAFRVNRLRMDPEQAKTLLETLGLGYRQLPWFGDGFCLEPDADEVLRKTDAYENGSLYLQNPSSMLPPVLLGDCTGRDVLDMCAAPGGKTTQIWSMAGGKCGLMACEQDRNRAKRLEFNLQKQGVRANVTVKDARKLDDFFRFDAILLDAPCSGTGTMLADRPATYGSFSEKLVKNCAQLQKQLLRKALTLLKPGCDMVYSTCSLLPEENERVVRDVLGMPGVETVPLPPALLSLPRLECGLADALLVCPDAEYEGFFAVKLHKS